MTSSIRRISLHTKEEKGKRQQEQAVAFAESHKDEEEALVLDSSAGFDAFTAKIKSSIKASAALLTSPTASSQDGQTIIEDTLNTLAETLDKQDGKTKEDEKTTTLPIMSLHFA